MASIKLKYRTSTVNGKEGSIYYQIIHNRITRQVKTNYKLFKEEWDSSKSEIIITNNTRKDNLLFIIEEVKWDIKKIKQIIKMLDNKGTKYTSDDIIAIFEKNGGYNSLFSFMQKQIIKLNQMRRYRTAETYSSTLKSFMKFRNNRDLVFTDINSDLMIMYESYLKQRGLRRNSISFYMRILRAVYNKAVEEEFTINNNPFKYVYTGVDKTIKRAITLQVVKKIKELDLLSYPTLDFARDMFMFSFYTRGMSFIDMAFLKKKDIMNGAIIYRRRKTGQQLIIKLEKCMEEIIDKYKKDNNTPYLLPIIKVDTINNERLQYKNSLSAINRCLKKIGMEVGMFNNLSMYVARHSWASCAKCKNIPISVISEGMGHDSETYNKNLFSIIRLWGY